MARKAIEIEGFRHANPIPAACRVGPLLVSSVVVGRDPVTNEMPGDVADQLANLFDHVGAILAEAGADWRHVARMSFYVPDLSLREAINGPWLEHFPDPTSRPARHTQAADGPHVSCEFIAYVDD
jgi:enamine deaminase RidA (YjgF/YER057c/UK114 family)